MRKKPPMPAVDDPRLRRTCNRCNRSYDRTEARCPGCGCPEFRLPEFYQGELDFSEVEGADQQV